MTIISAEELHSPDFWIANWEASLTGDTDTIRKGYTTPGYWDSMSVTYDRNHDDEYECGLEKTIGLLSGKGLFEEGMTVLDVGCGTGKLAIAFARRGARVTALDFSMGMLERLLDNCPSGLEKNIETVREDWETLNLDSRGWRQGFDLVVANMTPAASTPQGLQKLVDAARGGCWVKVWARKHRSALLETLWEHFKGAPMTDRPSQAAFIFNLLYSMGYYPDLLTDRVNFTRSEKVESVTERYATYFAGILGREKETLTEDVRAVLDTVAHDGIAEETITGRTGSLMWSVK